MNKSVYRLIAGFKRFHEKYFAESLESSLYTRLASSGQSPKTLLIGCSDSRVDPAILTDAAPGDLFVIRNVANLVPPCENASTGFHGTSSAMEFAVVNLKVENVIVLGHRQCGGIRALMSESPETVGSFINRWIRIAREARENVLRDYPHEDHEARIRLAEMESIKVSIKNLRSFPFIQEAVASRNLNVMGIYFDLEKGELWELDEPNNKFRQLEL